MHQKWLSELDQTIADKLNGTVAVSTLNPKEVEQLKAFLASPLKRMIDTNSVYEVEPPSGELQKQLALTTEKMAKGVKQLGDKIKGYKDSEFHKLFIFANQFEQFAASKPEGEQARALECQKRFCDGMDARCASQLLGLAADFSAIIPLIEATKMGQIMAAEVARVMTKEEATEQRTETVNNAVLGLAELAGGGLATKLVPAIGKGIRAMAGNVATRVKSVQESIASTLSSGLRQKATTYLRGNARANREATSLFNRINLLASSKPGHVSEELMARMQTSVSKVLGDIYSTNNLRFLKEYDQMLNEISKVPKGSKEYNELISRLELRTRALEAIYKNTSPGSFEARVHEAIQKSDIPKDIARDVEHCFVTGSSSQSSFRFLDLLFARASATLRPDKFCDIPIAKILKEQDPNGWVTLPNGDKQRFLIEKWDCDDCGTEKVPAWVHVLRANDKEDLAQVTHCPGCGNPKETHEKYYGAWEKDGRGQISNATSEDIVKAGPGKDKAKKAAESKEHHCGFCGTVMDVGSAECKSCGAGDIADLADTSTRGQGAAPHTPRSKPSPAERSGNGRNASRRDEPDSEATKATGSSEVASGNKGILIAGGAAVATAAGAGGYYLLKSEDVSATVSSMNWNHKITLERNTIVSKSDWRSSIPGGAFDVGGCYSKFSHNDQVACGSESYTISGSCSSSSSNGITTETCSPDTTGTRTVYCDDPIYRDWCSYKIYQWVYVTDRSTSGAAPTNSGALPWPELSARGTDERTFRTSSYSVEFEFDAFGKPRRSSISPNSEADFRDWKIGTQATGTFRRATGIGNLKKK